MYRELSALIRREGLRYGRAPLWIITSMMVPILYLVLFGQGFDLDKLINTGGITPQQAWLGAPDYFSFFAVGMMGFVAMTMSLFAGANVIFDKQLGIIKRMVATPAPRSAIFAAPLIFRSVMGTLPAFLALGLAILFAHIPGLVGMTVTAAVTPVGVAEIIGATLLLSLMFNALFIAFGFVLDKPESYFGIVNMLNLPILFTSNALYPPSAMPVWLQSIVQYNPVSMMVTVLRQNLFQTAGYYPYPPEIYLLGLIGWAVGIIAIALYLGARALRTP